jgi:hypothetical protein
LRSLPAELALALPAQAFQKKISRGGKSFSEKL